MKSNASLEQLLLFSENISKIVKNHISTKS